MPHCRAAGASLIALACTTVPAAAESDEQVRPAIVVVGERTAAAEEEVTQRPGGADIVTAEDYEDRLAVSLREALAFSPGVYAQPRFGQEVRLSIRGSGISRGFHMRGLTLMQDGIPINLADDNGDFQELDPLVFRYIQVFRGANGLRYGSSTLGGAINGVTPTGRTDPGIAARLDGGSFGTVRALVSAGFADERGDGWLTITGDRSDGERDHAERRSLRFHGNIGLWLSPAVETRFYASAQTIRQELPGGLPLATALERPKTGNDTGDQARDIDSLRLQSRTTVALGGGTLEFGGFGNFKELDHPIFQVVDQVSTDWGGFARLDLARGPLAVTLGATARFGTVASQRFVNKDGERGARTFEADQRAETIDLYGEARYRFGALSLIAGGVYSRGEREQDQVLPARVSGHFADDPFSPRFGVLWEPRDNLQLYANYSRSHEMPGFIELAQIASFVPLATQRAWTAEVGARGRVGIAAFDVSLYRATVDHEVLQFSVGPDIPATTFNADKTLHQGIEAGLDLQFTPWARLRQIYQLNDFRFRDDRRYGDNRLPVIPRHLYRAELRLGRDPLAIAPSLEWVPQGAWADYANTLKLEGYALLGLSAQAQVGKGLDLFFDARNLTGKKAIGDVTAVVDFGALQPFQRTIFYPVERRALYGGVRARF